MPVRERSRVKTILTLRVTLELPLGATMQDARQYVKDAVLSKMVGVETIDNPLPMSKLDPASVRVSYHSKEVTY